MERPRYNHICDEYFQASQTSHKYYEDQSIDTERGELQPVKLPIFGALGKRNQEKI